MKNQFTGITHYPVYSNEVNAQAELPVWRIVECLIDAASRHAEKNGFGYRNLIANGEAWVLARLAVDMKRYPGVDETLTVETWVEGCNKHFSSRNFKMTDEAGEVIGYGRSVWSVINFTTRESSDLLKYEGISRYITDLSCPIERPGRIPAVSDERPEAYRIRVSDLDINRHLTTAKYISHLLDLFPLETFDRETIHRFEIQFVNEVLYDEQVILSKQLIHQGEYALEMKNEAGTVCCKCRCVFVEKNPA